MISTIMNVSVSACDIYDVGMYLWWENFNAVFCTFGIAHNGTGNEGAPPQKTSWKNYS